MKRGRFGDRLKAISIMAACVYPLVASGLGAQDTTIVSWASLRERPRLHDSTGWFGLHYPALLMDAAVGGEVVALIVVDDRGTPDTTQLEVLRSSHELFADQLRVALPQWRFSAPMADGRAVRTRIPVRLVFEPPPRHEVPLRESWSVLEDSTELRIAVRWEPLPRRLTMARDTADVKWAKLQVLLNLLGSDPGAYDTPAIVCLRWGDKTAIVPPAMIRRVRMYYPDVVNADTCPRAGPAGPVWIRIETVQPWTEDLWVISASGQVGNVGSRYYCESARDERGRWSARCEMRAQYVN